MGDRTVREYRTDGSSYTRTVKSTEKLATEAKTDADLQAAMERQRKAREEAERPRPGLGGLAAAAARRKKQMPEALESLKR